MERQGDFFHGNSSCCKVFHGISDDIVDAFITSIKRFRQHTYLLPCYAVVHLSYIYNMYEVKGLLYLYC